MCTGEKVWLDRQVRLVERDERFHSPVVLIIPSKFTHDASSTANQTLPVYSLDGVAHRWNFYFLYHFLICVKGKNIITGITRKKVTRDRQAFEHHSPRAVGECFKVSVWVYGGSVC